MAKHLKHVTQHTLKHQQSVHNDNIKHNEMYIYKFSGYRGYPKSYSQILFWTLCMPNESDIFYSKNKKDYNALMCEFERGLNEYLYTIRDSNFYWRSFWCKNPLYML